MANNLNPPVGYRKQEFDEEYPILLGKKIELKIPTGEVRSGQFAIVELFGILASHNERTFGNTENYPLDARGENVNDRNYSNDTSAQAKVREFAQNLEADRLVITSRTPAGTPIISVDGIVVSGNNRTMSLKLAVEQFPEKYKEYTEFLSDEINSFGFKRFVNVEDSSKEYFVQTESRSKKFKHPVLVRIDYDFPAYNALELSKYNKDTKKAERPVDKAIKLGKILESSERCTDVIVNIVGNYETFSELYSNAADQKQLKDTLISCDILTTQELPNFWHERTFTDAGKDLLENLLAGMVLEKDALLAINDYGSKLYRGTIITSLPVLIANKGLEEYSLIKPLNEALLLQNKIANSKLNFIDYMAQGNVFDDAKASKPALYLNRLLAAGRNTFKKAFESYNNSALQNQGESLFGEKPTATEIFDAHIASKIEAAEAKVIENSQSDVNTITQSNPEPIEFVQDAPKFLEPFIPQELKELVSAQKQSVKMTENPFINSNFFKENPTKILALQAPGLSRWKKPIIEYKGDLDLSRIDASIDFVAVETPAQPTVSTVTESVFDSAPFNPAIQSNIEKALTQSKKDIEVKKACSKKQTPATDQTLKQIEDTESYSVREVWDMLNPEVSVEDLQAFMYYKNAKGRPILSNDWIKIAGIDASQLYSDTQRDKLVISGNLFYFNGQFLPAFLYLAENVYEKHTKLTAAGENSGQDIDFIKSNYGEAVLKNQIQALETVFKNQYDKRLTLKAGGEGLIINPVSKFAKQMKISELAEGVEFKWKRVTAAADKYYGKPDFKARQVLDKDKYHFTELSLTDAFCLWLITDDTIQFKGGITYADIIRVYIQAGNKPKTEAIADDTMSSKATYSGANLKLKNTEDSAWERLKAKCQVEGDRLFLEFLSNQLTLTDKIRIETQWNATFNAYVPIDYNRVPVAFRCNRYDMGKPMEIKPEKREAVAMMLCNDSEGICYDVGVGKTPSAIFTVAQMMEVGYAKRPLLSVPNQTYKQWISEFKKFAAHIPINEFYNLSEDYIQDWRDMQGQTKAVPEYSVSLMTYEGVRLLGLKEETISTFKQDLYDILMQKHKDSEKISDKKRDREAEKVSSLVEGLIGQALTKTNVAVEDFGFDFIGFDEAHALKKVFTSVQGESEENLGSKGGETQAVQRYKINSGKPSVTAIKGFILTQYFQRFHGGNTMLLTATPFTNSPLEIYSMLSLVAHRHLKELGLENIQTFFENYIAVSYEMVINSRLRPERRQIITGFNNLISLQAIIRRFLNYKTGEQVNVPRPNKIVLPLRNKMVNGTMVALNEDERIDTVLPLTALQTQLMDKVKQYADGDIEESMMCAGALIDEEDEEAETSEGVELDEETLTSDEKIGVRLLKSMNHARNLALSPYIFDCSGLGTPTAEKYITTSNKLLFTMESIRTMKDWHAKDGSDMSGVIIYMDRGVEFFKLIRQYLIENLGFAEHEVGIISSQVMIPTPGKMAKEDKKEYLKNLFLGQRFNPVTLEMEELSGSERMKIVIGSSTIKEGINLQKHTSVLFDCWEDWNPTDVQQLEGRAWRQGNKFKTVRIVHPLMIDSMDIFMFQKLEEKTTRINTIWESDGRTNVLKTEDFNPKELKYSLIKDPKVLAQMEIAEISEQIDEQIVDVENQIKRNNKIIQFSETIKNYTERAENWLEEYRPTERKRTPENIAGLLQEVIRKKTDQYGKPIVHDWKRDQKKPAGFYSTIESEPTKPYWYDDFIWAIRQIKREEKDYLIPKNLKLKDLEDYNQHLTGDIQKLQLDKAKATDKDAVNQKAQEIVDYREANKIEPKTVAQVVKDFAKLNYLLGEVKFPSVKVDEKPIVPLLDAEGLPRIDTEALAALDQANIHEPETKRLHTTEVKDGDTVRLVYTEDREQLHEAIIDNIIGEAVCVDQQQPIAVLTGGAPGSGKSTFLSKYAPYMQSDQIYKIDADEVRAQLPEYKGWNSASTHQESRDIVEKLLDRFDKPCKHDLLYDGTMNNAKKYIPIIRRLKQLGYKVFIAYMDVPKEVSIKRALERFRNNRGGTTKYGRYVPMFVIEEFFQSGKAGFEELKSAVDGYVLIDSLTMQIKEQGGEQIPQNRSYSGMFDGNYPSPEEMELKPSSETDEISSAIEMLKELLPELKGKDKKEAKEAIELLTDMLS